MQRLRGIHIPFAPIRRNDGDVRSRSTADASTARSSEAAQPKRAKPTQRRHTAFYAVIGRTSASPVRFPNAATAKTPRNRGDFSTRARAPAKYLRPSRLNGGEEPSAKPPRRRRGGGESGIRTHGTLPYTRFPSVRLQPLGHLSGNLLRASRSAWPVGLAARRGARHPGTGVVLHLDLARPSSLVRSRRSRRRACCLASRAGSTWNARNTRNRPDWRRGRDSNPR